MQVKRLHDWITGWDYNAAKTQGCNWEEILDLLVENLLFKGFVAALLNQKIKEEKRRWLCGKPKHINT